MNMIAEVKRTSLAQSAKGQTPCPCSLPISSGLRRRLVSFSVLSSICFSVWMLRTWEFLLHVLEVLVSVAVRADVFAGLGVAHVLCGS